MAIKIECDRCHDQEAMEHDQYPAAWRKMTIENAPITAKHWWLCPRCADQLASEAQRCPPRAAKPA